jgi:hypothetical protein
LGFSGWNASKDLKNDRFFSDSHAILILLKLSNCP